MEYEKLLSEAISLGLSVFEIPLTGKIKGLYGENTIWLNKNIPTATEKYCILAEELGHYHTTSGNILDQRKLINRKQEKLARSWGYEKLVPLHKIIDAHKNHVTGRFELAEFLGVTEPFLECAIERYREKFGDTVKYENYAICFNPLGVIEWFDD